MLKIAEAAKQTVKHTLAPLKYIPSHIVEGPIQVRTVQGPGAHKEGWLVCEVSADEHGAEIVRAINCHSDLLTALKAMVLNDKHTYRDCHKAALASIARAEGRSQGCADY
jgi:hypothetical protein